MIDYKDVYDSFPDMCISLNPHSGEIIAANDMLLNTLGYSFEELKKLSLYDLYDVKEADKVLNNLESIKLGKQPENSEFVVRKRNGEIMEVSLLVSFVHDEVGNMLYTNAVWRDISELKAAQYELIVEKQKVERQNRISAKQNKEFQDAVNYASNLQRGILPTTTELNRVFPKSFVLNVPRDIVSGDFYWMHETEDFVIFALLDCTGHGVPGALMSMMGAALLNQIVIENGQTCPEVILNNVRAGIIKSLGQGQVDSTNSDGMDAMLCCLDKGTNELEFAGANSSFMLIRAKSEGAVKSEICDSMQMIHGGENNSYDLYEFKGNKQPIGYYFGMGVIFSKSKVQLQKEDRIYFYSDGFKDQLGGERNKKYMARRFREFILKLSGQPIVEQDQIFAAELAYWKNGAVEQTDDICIWGIEII